MYVTYNVIKNSNVAWKYYGISSVSYLVMIMVALMTLSLYWYHGWINIIKNFYSASRCIL